MRRLLWIFALLCGVLATGCKSKESPEVVPHSELPEVARVEVVVIEGHLHGTYGFHETADPADQKYIKRFNKFVYNVQPDGTLALAEGSDKRLYAVGGEGEYDPSIDSDSERSKKVLISYGIWIDYFDKAGRNITSELLENGHQTRLQHFFTTEEMRPTFDGDAAEVAKRATSEKFITYIYCDTDPLSARIKDGAKVIGTTNPIGHKGYLGFAQPRSECQLRITLCDLAKVGKLSGGKPRPATALPKEAKVLYQLTIPVTVYAFAYDQVEADTIAEMTPEEKKYLTSIATAYGITLEEAFAAYLNRLNAPPHSDSGYWF